MQQRTLDLVRLRAMLADLNTAQETLAENDADEPFVIYLTERMLRDIESCRRICANMRNRAAYPSLN